MDARNIVWCKRLESSYQARGSNASTGYLISIIKRYRSWTLDRVTLQKCPNIVDVIRGPMQIEDAYSEVPIEDKFRTPCLRCLKVRGSSWSSSNVS